MKTKKLILVIFLTFIGAIGAYAQKTNVRMQETQARLLDVTSNAYVKPLTVELQIDKSKGRIKDEWTLTREQAEQEMNGDLVNIRSYAIYMSSQKHNADVIVAATFNVKTNDDGNGYKVTVIGYPATFINWKTAEASDYEWIRMEKTLTTADKDKIAAVIKQQPLSNKQTTSINNQIEFQHEKTIIIGSRILTVCRRASTDCIIQKCQHQIRSETAF